MHLIKEDPKIPTKIVEIFERDGKTYMSKGLIGPNKEVYFLLEEAIVLEPYAQLIMRYEAMGYSSVADDMLKS